jgi:hypothetical protein
MTTQSADGEISMEKTVNLAIPFDFLLQAVAKLSPDDKQRLWDFLDTDLHDSVGTLLDADEETEVATAYAEYEAGDFVTLDEYTSKRAERMA